VRELLEAISEHDLPVHVDEVIVVDNGSTDSTAAVASAAGARVVSEPRRGYGRACLAGALAANNAEILLFMDGDRSDDPREMGVVLAPLLRGDADLVVGSRLMGSYEPGSLTAPQRVGNVIACHGLARFYNVRISDFGPFRAIERTDLLSLGMREMTYGWPLEMLARAGKANLRVVNVPVTWRRRAGGISKVSGSLRASLTTGYRYLGTLVRCR
jgi:glycosyltransferase involved in cell wall biosynthesis